MNKALFYFFVSIVCVTLIYGKPLDKSKKKSKNWDFLVFTQQWPAVGCLSWEVLNPSHRCIMPSEITTWTVHGIWPSLSGHESPSFCNKSWTFDEDQLIPIKDELDQYWPNLYAKTPVDQLWAHEWDKHGTCAASLPALSTQLLFFSQGLKWAKQYNMMDILSKSGIHPSYTDQVKVSDIRQAVKNAIGVTPILTCDYISKNKTHYIYEIEICFSKELELTDCNNEALSDMAYLGTESCPKSDLVWYPPIAYTSTKHSSPHYSSWPVKTLSTVLKLISLTL